MATSGSSEPTRPDEIGEPDRTVTRSNRVIPATCLKHGAAQGFTNLVMRQREGIIELDPHATGGCVLHLDEDAAGVVRDQLREWLG
jgi:hypothetical protein